MMSQSKILVVDDQYGIRQTLSLILEDQGYQVEEAIDGYAAIEAVKHSNFDLILLDVSMPGINGVQTLREIMKIRPEVSVAMMTAFSMEEMVEDAISEGALTVLHKPLDIDLLLSFVAEKCPESGQRPVLISCSET